MSNKQGGKLEGNASRKCLNSVDSLELAFQRHSPEVLFDGMPFIRMLRAFRKVVVCCYSRGGRRL